ncbi:MAG: major facilitator superfamily 1 [Nonomuraea muscovyensis]|nr:major facilitator superfamily 1 [Nonomuraea muscovyensis]
MVGTRALGVVYPLLAVLVTESVAWAGWVVFAWSVPMLLYVPAGAMVARWNPRRVLLWTESIRALSIASIGVALVWWELQIWHLLLVAFCEAALAVFSSLAETTLISAIVDKKDIGGAMAVHESSVHVAVLAGRPIGGLLFGLGPAAPVLAHLALTAGFLYALRRLKRPDTSRSDRSLLAEIHSGLREAHDHQFIRVATWLVAALNLIVQALLIVVIAAALVEGVPPLLTGLVLAASGVGGMIGSMAAPGRERLSAWIAGKTSGVPVVERLADAAGLTGGARSTLVLHTWLWVSAFVLAASMSTPVSFFAALMLMGLGGGLSNVTIRTVIGRLEHSLVARVTGVHRLVTHGASALGPLVGTALIMTFGVRAAVFVLMGLTLVIAVVVTWLPGVRASLSPGRAAVGEGELRVAGAPFAAGQPESAAPVESGAGDGLGEVPFQTPRQATA